MSIPDSRVIESQKVWEMRTDNPFLSSGKNQLGMRSRQGNPIAKWLSLHCKDLNNYKSMV